VIIISRSRVLTNQTQRYLRQVLQLVRTIVWLNSALYRWRVRFYTMKSCEKCSLRRFHRPTHQNKSRIVASFSFHISIPVRTESFISSDESELLFWNTRRRIILSSRVAVMAHRLNEPLKYANIFILLKIPRKRTLAGRYKL
jgi:hypothetical protein